ncbi:MAG TPA: hypothetical protein VLA19_17915 [Herpetosiphonaceae bacterium]|nr:hypothetical protein [Herpetosiphonaceae bacterium]
MTWLDVVCILALALIAAGGYVQGLIRGLVRLLALLGGGGLAAVAVLNLDTASSAPGTAAVAVAITTALLAIAGLAAWMLSRSLPSSAHAAPVNRLLGVVPALALGFVLLAVLVGLAERVALTTETQAFIRAGALSGRLVQLVDTIEQLVAGIR